MNRIECLDGLRGLAALWVLIGHCLILTGFSLPILGKPDLGVDLFILLSGFLMTFQFQLRKDREDWARPATWAAFWTRRFFRISPLYFVLLAAALLAGKAIYADRVVIDSFLGQPLQAPERYTDASASNIALHITYLFGLLPEYAFRTPLPDWSLGLEMQFYAVFPFAVLLAGRLGWIRTALCVSILSVSIALLAGALGAAYPMPSFLPLKMHLFAAGMLIAAALERQQAACLAAAAVLVAIPIGGKTDLLHLVVREGIFLGFFALVHWRAIPWIDRLSRLLGAPPFHWLGELSYGVYLVHLLVLHRVAAWTIEEWAQDMPAVARFTLTFAITAPIAYGLAYASYRLVELQGQSLGRAVIARFGRRKLARQTRAEEYAAP